MAYPRQNAFVRSIARVERAAWRGVFSPRLGLVLLIALLLLCVLGGLLPQLDMGSQSGSPQRDALRARLRSRWGPAAAYLETLGLLGVFRSRLFYVFLALLGAVAVLRLAQVASPSWVPAPPRRANSRVFVWSCEPLEAWQRVCRALSATGQRVVRHTVVADMDLGAVRGTGLERWAPGLVYAGIVVLLTASVVEWGLGWVGPQVELVLGETRPLGSGTSLSARLEQVDLVPLADGTPGRFDSHISLLRGSALVRRVILGRERSATLGGLSLYQLGFGPAVRVSAQTGKGTSLRLQQMVGDRSPQRVLRLRFSGLQQEQLLAIPDADLVARVVYYGALPNLGFRGRVLHVQLIQGSTGQSLAERFIDHNDRVTAADVGVDLAFEYAVSLRAEREPGLPVAAAGAVLVLAGIVSSLTWPPREAWIAVRQDGSRCVCQLSVREADRQARWALALAASLAEAADG